MGWFDGLFDNITGKDIVSGIGAWYGANQATKANNQALQAKQIANQQALALTQQGNREAQTRLEQVQKMGQPGVDALRTVVAQDPNKLTPQQQIVMDDNARNLNARLAKSGLRGAGRSIASVFSDVQNRTKAGMLEQNQNRSDRAASSLATPSINAQIQGANVANQGGATAANLATDMGEATGNAVTSNAAVEAQTIGNVLGSVLARDDSRKSRYGSTIPG
ncbi:MAG: hypothetical protein EG825_00460 [Rhodocyclaceae bacterium]|nr:hypothetical protein [Rhodocyclaceae bacterium]